MSSGTPGKSALIDSSDCVLVVIDIQEKLLPVITGKEEILANAVKLVQFAEIVKMPVVLTEQQKLGPTVDEITSKLPDGKAVEKITFDCFAEDGFTAELARHGRKTLILAGIESHICVAQTALTGMLGNRVHVVSDAVGSRDPRNRETALARLRHEGATITSTEMVIYEVLRRAGTDEFRAVLKLVK